MTIILFTLQFTHYVVMFIFIRIGKQNKKSIFIIYLCQKTHIIKQVFVNKYLTLITKTLQSLASRSEKKMFVSSASNLIYVDKIFFYLSIPIFEKKGLQVDTYHSPAPTLGDVYSCGSLV